MEEEEFRSIGREAESQSKFYHLYREHKGLELAICVCMYSEDKKMLKSTLAGISNNISTLVCKGNINPDKIGVFIMMDGIEKVEQGVVDYFEEL